MFRLLFSIVKSLGLLFVIFVIFCHFCNFLYFLSFLLFLSWWCRWYRWCRWCRWCRWGRWVGVGDVGDVGHFITLSKYPKGHKFFGWLSCRVFQQWVSERLSEWQGNLKSCLGTAKTHKTNQYHALKEMSSKERYFTPPDLALLLAIFFLQFLDQNIFRFSLCWYLWTELLYSTRLFWKLWPIAFRFWFPKHFSRRNLPKCTTSFCIFKGLFSGWLFSNFYILFVAPILGWRLTCNGGVLGAIDSFFREEVCEVWKNLLTWF